MPFVHPLSFGSRAAIAALSIALAAIAAPCQAHAGSLDDAPAIGQPMFFVDGAWAAPTSFAHRAAQAVDLAVAPRFLIGATVTDGFGFDEPMQAANEAASADTEAPIAGATALDDRVLARQRGTGPGLMTVAASTQALQNGHSVTLWDEIAPPVPAPVPADSARPAQSNAVSYFRQ
ncbi:hypothetical protein [Trinickia sp.]|uniref:hypothetical protein n=1 Tax=Trinickia sp. TaxID=2571163 RepID=UPI003F81EE82